MHRFTSIPSPEDGTRSGNNEHAIAIKRWTREVLKVADDAVITVAEFACSDAGCPLLETTISVFEEGRTRSWKLTRPRIAVTKMMVQQTLQSQPT